MEFTIYPDHDVGTVVYFLHDGCIRQGIIGDIIFSYMSEDFTYAVFTSLKETFFIQASLVEANTSAFGHQYYLFIPCTDESDLSGLVSLRKDQSWIFRSHLPF